MSEPENLGAFIKDTKPLLTEYMEVKLDVFRLQAIRIISKSAGYLLWMIISLFLFFIIVIFCGIVLGCWFSTIFDSYVLGFGLTTLIIMAIFALLAIFRKSLFVYPIMQGVIRKAMEDFKVSNSDSDNLL